MIHHARWGLAALVMLASACSRSDSGVLAESETGSTAPDAAWVGTTPNGIQVIVTPVPNPPSVGSLMLTLDTPDDHPARSVDLVSPTMPAHGVVRSPVVDGRVAIDVPMEGEWAVYVNFDDVGAVSAQFSFSVARSDGSSDHGMAH
ncbi:MAG: hypothetical protein AB7T31_17890 [Gemmatimonadales bacterium]